MLAVLDAEARMSTSEVELMALQCAACCDGPGILLLQVIVASAHVLYVQFVAVWTPSRLVTLLHQLRKIKSRALRVHVAWFMPHVLQGFRKEPGSSKSGIERSILHRVSLGLRGYKSDTKPSHLSKTFKFDTRLRAEFLNCE